MMLLDFFKNYIEIINIVLIVLVFPVLHTIKASRKRDQEHDAFIMESIEKSTKAIEQLHCEMLASQTRYERMENAVLFIANDEKLKDVIAILRGYKQSGVRYE